LKKCGQLFTAKISLSTMVIDDVLCGVAIIQDYTTLQKWVENIERKANTDSLTLLYNRHYLDTVTLPDNRWFNSHKSIAVLYLDLNGFKPLNDKYGHAFGDLVLKTIAQRMKENLRLDDLIFRVGGDEFVIMLPLAESDSSSLTVASIMECHTSSKAAQSIAEKLHKEITLPINFEGKVVNVGVSIGVGLYPHDIDDIEITIKLADKAMYYAKQQHQPIAYVSDLPKKLKK